MIQKREFSVLALEVELTHRINRSVFMDRTTSQTQSATTPQLTRDMLQRGLAQWLSQLKINATGTITNPTPEERHGE